MKTVIFIIIIAVLGVWFAFSKLSVQEEGIVLARNGLHWHSDLSIYILGRKEVIPAGIGLNIQENPIHTHETDGVIHMEFTGLVRQDSLKLGNFFRIWGKTLNKDCIFDKCAGTDGRMKMLVNGKENLEFENYIMQDKDKIEIIFE